MISPPPRRGYALIECLVLITVMSLLAGLCAGTIHLLLRLDRSQRASTETATDLARLARDFRQDAHEAPTQEPPQRTEARISFPLDGSESVEYLIRPFDVLRTVRIGDKVRRWETYRRPARCSARFELDNLGPRRLVSISFDRLPDGPSPSPYRDYRIEAVLGKHRQIEASPE